MKGLIYKITFFVFAFVILIISISNIWNPFAKDRGPQGKQYIETEEENIVPTSYMKTQIVAWGRDNAGQLGGGKIFEEGFVSNAYAQVPGSILNVSSGGIHSLAVGKNKIAYTWGSNASGQLGRKTTEDYTFIPQSLDMFDNVMKVAAGNNHSLILLADGTVWTFGSNFHGQLGNGTHTNSPVPIQVQELNDIVDIAAGHRFSLALSRDGFLWAWGASCEDSQRSRAKQLLENFVSDISVLGGYVDPYGHESKWEEAADCIYEEFTGIESTVPKKIDVPPGVIQFDGGYGHVVLLTNKGEVWTFGCNAFGQLGYGNKENISDHSIPKKVEGLSGIVSIDAGFRHSMALGGDGTVWAWGANQRGQLGDETKIEKGSPVAVHDISNVQAISAGRDFSLALKADGTVWAWGDSRGENIFSLETLNNTPHSTHPIQVDALHDIAAISGGGGHGLSIIRQDIFEPYENTDP